MTIEQALSARNQSSVSTHIKSNRQFSGQVLSRQETGRGRIWEKKSLRLRNCKEGKEDAVIQSNSNCIYLYLFVNLQESHADQLFVM